MSECKVVLLSDRAVLRVTGEAARNFLQGLITNHIDQAKPGSATHAGLLTPQGKILVDFFVLSAGDGFLLELAKAKLADLIQRLTIYKLRTQVAFAAEPSHAVAASWGSTPLLSVGSIVYADPRLPELGLRILLPANADISALGCALASEDEYHARRIALGVPEGGRDYSFGDAFPHEAMFDQLNGVDFKKGCFVGQEVVSRMEHRGTARKRIVGVEGEGQLPLPGTEIMAGSMAIGTLGSVTGSSGLALLRLDRRYRLAALIHDAPEYVIGDLISPFKAALSLDYKEFEKKLLAAIHIRFGLPPELPADITKLIKRADKIAAYYESISLAEFSVEEGRRYFGQPRGLKPGLVAKLSRLTPLPASDSEAKFLNRFNELAP